MISNVPQLFQTFSKIHQLLFYIHIQFCIHENHEIHNTPGGVPASYRLFLLKDSGNTTYILKKDNVESTQNGLRVVQS